MSSQERLVQFASYASCVYSVCPGRFFADEVGFCIATAILWAFEIECVDKSMTLEDIQWVDSAIR